MGKMNNWIMDMEDNIVSAIESGATTTNEVVAFARTNMSLVDFIVIALCTTLFAYKYWIT